MSDTRKFIEGIFNGQIPVRKQNPQTGQEEVYYREDDDNNGNEYGRTDRNKVLLNRDSLRRLNNLSAFIDKVNSGDFRTAKSAVPDNWGEGTEASLNNYLATNYQGRIMKSINCGKI